MYWHSQGTIAKVGLPRECVCVTGKSESTTHHIGSKRAKGKDGQCNVKSIKGLHGVGEKNITFKMHNTPYLVAIQASYHMPTLPYPLLKQEVQLLKQTLLPQSPTNELGGYQ